MRSANQYCSTGYFCPGPKNLVVTSHSFGPPVPQWNGEGQCRFFVGTGKIDRFILTIMHLGNGRFHFEKEGEVSTLHFFTIEFRIIFCRCVFFLSPKFSDTLKCKTNLVSKFKLPISQVVAELGNLKILAILLKSHEITTSC